MIFYYGKTDYLGARNELMSYYMRHPETIDQGALSHGLESDRLVADAKFHVAGDLAVAGTRTWSKQDTSNLDFVASNLRYLQGDTNKAAASLVMAGSASLGFGLGECSFPSDTPVTTQDGFQPIGAVVTGTMVLAWDEATHSTGYYPVTAVWTHNDPVITVLDIDGEIIEATPEHLFYTPMHGWLKAKDLFAGVAVRKVNGKTGIVRGNVSIVHTQRMWNLTIADAHTYFVGEGQLLVHTMESWMATRENLLKLGNNATPLDAHILTQMLAKFLTQGQ